MVSIMLRDKQSFDMKPTAGFKMEEGTYRIVNARRSITTGRFGEQKAVLVQLPDAKCAYLPRVLANNAYDNFEELLERIKKNGGVSVTLVKSFSNKFNSYYLDGFFFD